jgi:hypothetical protein
MCGADFSNPPPHTILPDQDGLPLMGLPQVDDLPASPMPLVGPDFMDPSNVPTNTPPTTEAPLYSQCW